MPRHADVIPKTTLELRIPLDLRAKLDLHLASELRGCVPYGGYSAFFERLLRDFFSKKEPSYETLPLDSTFTTEYKHKL